MIWSILERGKSSFTHHFFKSVKYVHIRHFPFFLQTITMLASHCEYLTSLINPASNNRYTSAFTASIFSSDILRSFCFLGFACGLTCNLCSITSLLTPTKSEVDQAKTSMFLLRKHRSYVCSSRLISALMQTVLSGTLGSSATMVKLSLTSIDFLNSIEMSC
jgi:hypothetical protein